MRSGGNKTAISLGDAAVLAHEINNPLEALANYLYLARTVPGESERFLLAAEKVVGQIAGLTRNALQGDPRSDRRSLIDLHDVVEDIALIFGEVARSREVTLVLGVPAGSLVAGNPDGLRQVFRNLVGNALDASPRGGKVMVRAKRWSAGRPTDAPGCRVSVADAGQGIAPAHRDRIFEPFFTTKGSEGNGLGLWVVAEIVRRHRGTIRVRTRTTPGRSGTVFMLFFPSAGTGEPSD
jgi:signal transduction histidine kinase